MTSSAAHLVHGMGTVLEAPTWPAITAVEAETALARFPAAGGLVALEWHSPRPFSAATLLRTTHGTFFLKRHHRTLRSPSGLAEEHGFITHLACGGLSVPEVMTVANGATAIAIGDWSYELHRKAPGVDLYRDSLSWTPYFSHAQAYAAGAGLARLHQASRGFAVAARAPQPLVASLSILPALDPMAAVETYVAARPALAGFLTRVPWQRQLSRLFTASANGIAAELADLEPLWTHNDWHPSNLLWTPGGEVETVFDFGLADRSYAVHDIATAIERATIRWLELGQQVDDGLADPEAALALLEGYATILPLSRAELEAIIHLLPLVHLEFALSEIDYFAGVLADADQAMLAWDGYLIGHAEWFMSAAGADFLRRIDSFARS